MGIVQKLSCWTSKTSRELSGACSAADPPDSLVRSAVPARAKHGSGSSRRRWAVKRHPDCGQCAQRETNDEVIVLRPVQGVRGDSVAIELRCDVAIAGAPGSPRWASGCQGAAILGPRRVRSSSNQ